MRVQLSCHTVCLADRNAAHRCLIFMKEWQTWLHFELSIYESVRAWSLKLITRLTSRLR
jgi:hypothetical protein